MINKVLLYNDINIYISYNNLYKLAHINLNNEKRYMKSFTNIGLDITIVEILNEDKISKDYFLFPDSEENINNDLINKAIYIPQYPKGKALMNAKGEIKEINGNEFTHLANTEQGSSGSPIFLENSIYVIGIHKEGSKNKSENYGDFIYSAINIIKDDIRIKRNTGKYINRKYIWDDDKYYIGEFKNNLPNGKGIKYYSNGNILYEGNFINGKFNGNGKYYYDDGDYFIGEYKNGLRNGKGTMYYSNGKIMYEGDWINDKAEGNGKAIYENDEYYIGQCKNGLPNGKGAIYYSNELLKYEGDWINGKFEGNGKYIYENNEYYIGEWKNGLKHGKGIYYYKRGEIGYEDIWNDDKLSGKGTYLFKKGDKYIRQFEDDSSNKKEINHSLVKAKIKDSDSLSENLLRCEVCVNEHQEDKTNQIIINFIDTRMNESKILIDSNKTIDKLIRFYFEINGRSDLYGDPSIIFLSCGKVISYDFKKKKTIKELMNELGEFDRIYIIVCDIDDKMEKKK